MSQIKLLVEDYYRESFANNAFFIYAQAGLFRGSHLKIYTESILHLLQHTPLYLKLCVDVCEQKNLRAEGEFFKAKLPEESGHDQWAESDLKLQEATFGKMSGAVIPPSLSAMLRYLRTEIQDNPIRYIGYMFFSEYFTVLAGPRWLEELQSKCSIPSDLLSSVGKHAELDKDHIVDDLQAMAKLVRPEDMPLLCTTVGNSIQFFDKFLNEVIELGNQMELAATHSQPRL